MAVACNRMKIKDLPAGERPYERMERYGPGLLTNAELIAIIIKTGSRDETSVDIAGRLLKQEGGGNLAYLHDISLEQLKSIRGIGRVKAIQIKAMLEFSKRISSIHGIEGRIVVKSPEEISRLLMDEMRYLRKEVFKIILLNSKNHVLKHVDVSTGSLNASIVHPREVFSEAVKASCSSVVLVHNHPSGDPEPSMEDIETTGRLVNAGGILGIKVLDHIIIGDGRYVSLKAKGLV